MRSPLAGQDVWLRSIARTIPQPIRKKARPTGKTNKSRTLPTMTVIGRYRYSLCR
jgi:hypothetical protein